MTADRIDKNLKLLEEKCQMLEDQCGEHIKALEEKIKEIYMGI